MLTSSNDIWCGNMGTPHPSKEQASSRTYKDLKEYVKHHIYRDRKINIWGREKTKVTDVTEQVRRRKWTWAGHVNRIRDGHCVSPPGNTTKGKDPEEDRRDGGETNYTTTGRVPSGRRQCKIGRCGGSMLRPSPTSIIPCPSHTTTILLG